ncbi:uncharacterized protein MELLADRAFT_106594 [Melampsora larici-populina 98AG31]|uniref:Uncharacterized protein n=1 Tax=Melampsora larici-populina (strain 98AG31 / pathotype 3-4-7) TaxID=747676 RepID=F4RM06_MELLP|nr:uncharacterized protein MELLADRAFT_106594 [Melampsora larici-populina 98AG31]EGG06671.1 hypothetical protein MELLADRAFT_106594 [Melampsora larici-populina 98AG31]
MSSSETRLRIVKLDEDNYPEWKGDITGALMSATLDEFIDSNATPVPEPQEQPVPREQKVLYEAYVIRQRKAAGIMYSHMSQQYRIMVESEGFINKPLDIWNLMKEKFQSTTSSSKGRAYSAFNQIVYTTLSQYIKDVRSNLAVMHAVGINFTDKIHECISETIVSKLPNSMETTLAILETERPLKTKTVFDVLEAHLIKYNKRHRADNNSIALAAINNRPPAHRSGHRYPYPTCSNGRHNPAVKGHVPDKCWIAFPHLRPANLPVSLPSKPRYAQGVQRLRFKDDEAFHFFIHNEAV